MYCITKRVKKQKKCPHGDIFVQEAFLLKHTVPNEDTFVRRAFLSGTHKELL